MVQLKRLRAIAELLAEATDSEIIAGARADISWPGPDGRGVLHLDCKFVLDWETISWLQQVALDGSNDE